MGAVGDVDVKQATRAANGGALGQILFPPSEYPDRELDGFVRSQKHATYCSVGELLSLRGQVANIILLLPDDASAIFFNNDYQDISPE